MIPGPDHENLPYFRVVVADQNIQRVCSRHISAYSIFNTWTIGSQVFGIYGGLPPKINKSNNNPLFLKNENDKNF
jgi:hypothetical protein